MNKFGEEFYQLYADNEEHEFFIDYVVNLGGEDNFAIVEFVPVNSILNSVC